ncbi:MAG TPA: chromate transporter [Burkholderiales bacterium]|nr:chromate transporter [Burkholderiales bacterium]
MQGSVDDAALRPSVLQLFVGFCKIGLSGFGGTMPFARRAIVDDRRWLSSEEFSALLGLSQFLPGANLSNLAICVGSRFRGARGAAAAFFGLMSGPFCIVLVLGALYDRYGDIPVVQSMLHGIAAAGAGLILAMGIEMARDLRSRPELFLVTGAVLVAIAVLRWPLLPVLLCAAPVGVWLGWRRLR